MLKWCSADFGPRPQCCCVATCSCGLAHGWGGPRVHHERAQAGGHCTRCWPGGATTGSGTAAPVARGWWREHEGELGSAPDMMSSVEAEKKWLAWRSSTTTKRVVTSGDSSWALTVLRKEESERQLNPKENCMMVAPTERGDPRH
jgi:hypothetical protein